MKRSRKTRPNAGVTDDARMLREKNAKINSMNRRDTFGDPGTIAWSSRRRRALHAGTQR